MFIPTVCWKHGWGMFILSCEAWTWFINTEPFPTVIKQHSLSILFASAHSIHIHSIHEYCWCVCVCVCVYPRACLCVHVQKQRGKYEWNAYSHHITVRNNRKTEAESAGACGSDSTCRAQPCLLYSPVHPVPPKTHRHSLFHPIHTANILHLGLTDMKNVTPTPIKGAPKKTSNIDYIICMVKNSCGL